MKPKPTETEGTAQFIPLSVALSTMSPYWAIEPRYADAAKASMDVIEFRAHAAEYAALSGMWDDDDEQDPDAYDVDANGVATINLSGPMMKRPSSWGRCCSTVLMRRAVRQAAADTNVKAIAIIIDSPGGNVEGVSDLAADIFKARLSKKIGAYIEDAGCSAAYWIASQCNFINCNSTAIVGSIGTYTVLYDETSAMSKMGYKAHLVHSAPFKGLGADGKVSEKLSEDVQRVIDELNAQFLAGVSQGRKMKPVKVAALADGRVHIGQNAVALKLCDAVSTIDEFYAKFGGENGADNQLDNEAESDDDDLPPDGDDPPGASNAGSTPASTTAADNRGKEKRQMRDIFAKALAKAGLQRPAMAVLSANDDTEEAVAQAFATSASEDAQLTVAAAKAQGAKEATDAMLSKSSANDEFVKQLAELGITTVAHAKEMLEGAKLGMEYAGQVRASAKAEAVRFMGAEIGKQFESQCDVLPVSMLTGMRDAWQAAADKKFGIGAKGEPAARVSAPGAVPVAVNAEQGADTKTAVEQLTVEQRTYLEKMGHTGNALENAAANFLKGMVK